MTKKNKARLLSLGVAFALVAVPALAQEAAEATSSGSVTIGAQGGTGIEDSSKLQQYETVPTGVYLSSAKYSWKNASDYFLSVKASKLGLDDQFAALAFGKKGSFKLDLSWDQNPNWMSNTAQSPYSQTIDGKTARLHVPDGMRLGLQNNYVPWVPGTATNPVGVGSCATNATLPCFFALEPWIADSPGLDLRYLRKTGRAGLSFDASPDLKFSLSYAREDRNGNKNTTFYGGSYNLEVATPIEYKTHDFKAEAEYAKGRFFATASFNYNQFINDVWYQEIDNAQRLQMTSPITNKPVYNDTSAFRLWLPPDNKAWSLDFAGGVSLPSRHKLTVSLSTGNMSSDRELIALSTNSNLGVGQPSLSTSFSLTPPYNSVSAEYDTMLAAVKLTGDPSPKFGYSLTFRDFKLTDNTGEYHFFSTVRGDVGASYSTTGFAREHEGYSKQTLKGEVHVLPVSGLRLGLGYGRDKSDYDIREYEDVTDKVLTASLDYNHSKFSFKGVFTNLKREPGTGNTEAIQPSWKGATQTDITERDRNTLSGMLTVTPTDTFSIALSGMRQTNEFAESVTGLLDQSFSQFGVDFTLAPNDKFHLTAGYVYEKYFFDMAAAYFPRGVPLPPNFDPKADPNYWSNKTEDKIDTFRAGLKWVMVPDKLDLYADVDYSKPRSDSNYTFVPGGTGEANGVWPATAVTGYTGSNFAGFPQVSKAFTIAKVKLAYHVQKNLTASVMWWKQKFDNVDWQTNNTTPYMGQVDPGSSRHFFLGAQVPSYDANMFRAALTYRF